MGLRRVPEAQDEAAPGDGNGMRSHGMASRHSDAPGLGEHRAHQRAGALGEHNRHAAVQIR